VSSSGTKTDSTAAESASKLPAIPAGVEIFPGGEGALGDEWRTEEGRIPQRYQIRESEDLRYLRCREAPGLGVSVDNSYAIPEAEARKLGRQVILLDGAGAFQPTIDDAKQLYNLDHHSGCLRAFTLATCEQALVLVLKGLELDKGDWKIYAGEPDLDTIFAIWVLLNHRRLRDLGPSTRDRIVPLIRLEGAIDANGFEVAEYCGLSQAMFKVAKEQLDRLQALEMEVKKAGEWDADPVGHTLRMLTELDHLVYTAADFADFAAVEEEYGHVEIGDPHVAVVCRDQSGIYEVEKRLKKNWGERLGIIALEKATGHYTLRRVAALAGINLERAYEKLNLLDPVVDGRPPEKRWGGSDDIGGSPKGVGTGLTPKDIRNILRLAYRPINGWDALRQLLRAGVGTLAAVAAAVATWFLFGRLVEAPFSPVEGAAGATLMAGAALVVSVILSFYFSQRRLWLYGWRRPAGHDWLLVAPGVILLAALGAAWVPPETWLRPAPGVPLGAREAIALGGSILLLALAAEATLRGLVHGLFLLTAPVQRVGGSWFISRPIWVSSAFYTVLLLVGWQVGAVAVPFALVTSRSLAVVLEPAVLLALGVGVGIGLGWIRERSSSLWPAVAAQALGFGLRLLVETRLMGS
jgi:hypothetical protein